MFIFMLPLKTYAIYVAELLNNSDRVNQLLSLPDFLVHGDMWISNLMFTKSENGALSEKLFKILDWQVCFLILFAMTVL